MTEPTSPPPPPVEPMQPIRHEVVPITPAPRPEPFASAAVVPEGFDGEPPTTVDRPHFPRIMQDGTELCGQCGQPWECPSMTAQREAAEAEVFHARAERQPATVELGAAAAAARMTVPEFLAVLAQQRQEG